MMRHYYAVKHASGCYLCNDRLVDTRVEATTMDMYLSKRETKAAIVGFITNKGYSVADFIVEELKW